MLVRLRGWRGIKGVAGGGAKRRAVKLWLHRNGAVDTARNPHEAQAYRNNMLPRSFPCQRAMEDEMHSDRIVLIAGIVALGLLTAAVTSTHVQSVSATEATASHVPIGPIADKKSASPGSKAANVFLLTGQ